MQYSIVVALLSAVSAGFFDGSNYEEFKNKLESSQNSLLTKDGKIRDDAFDLWKPSEINEWLAYHKIESPGTDHVGALIAKARAHKDKLIGDLKDLVDSPPPSEKILTKGAEFYEQSKQSLLDAWSDSALSNFLAARGEDIQALASYSHEQLVELAGKSQGIAADTKSKVSRYWFDSWSRDELESQLKALGKSVEGSRQKLADSLWTEYQQVKASANNGQKEGKKQADELVKSAEKWRKDTFDKWSYDDLKDYVSQFGPSAPTKQEQLVDFARKKYNYFVYGSEEPSSVYSQACRYADLAKVHVSAILGTLKDKLFAAKEEL